MNKIKSSLWTAIAALILISGILISGCATASAASPSSDNKANARKGPRIIAVGDIHGDYAAYETVLIAAGLSDKKGKWIGGETIFVQTGDIPDRGPDTRKIIDHIRSLQKQAKRKGGRVITLVGNHEAMNMTDDLRYVHPGEYAAFVTSKSEKLRERLFSVNAETLTEFYRQKNPEITTEEVKAARFKTMPLGKIEHQQAWQAKGKIGKWVAANPGIAVVHGNLFAHGGVSLNYARSNIKGLNKEIASALKKWEVEQSSIIHDPLGPLWYRGYSQGETAPSQANPDITSQQELDEVLNYFGATRMIVGHTPQRSGIKMSYDGKLFEIDTGMSKHYGGTQSFLRIEDGQVFAHDNGTITPL